MNVRCKAKRLNTDHLDLYLLHWRGEVPLDETVAIFETLKKEGKIAVPLPKSTSLEMY